MSYYILPKTSNNIELEIDVTDVTDVTDTKKPVTYISHSLYNYHIHIMNTIEKLKGDDKTHSSEIFSTKNLLQVVNPYEYIYTKVSGTKISVSKLKPFSSLFYDFLEISHILNLFDNYFDSNIFTLHIGENNVSSIECMNMIREDKNDTNLGFKNIDEYELYQDENSDKPEEQNQSEQNQIHFLFYEYDNDIGMIKFLISLLKKQKKEGSCVIKIENLFYKSIVDLAYLLTSLYEKIYIIKPTTSKVTNCEKYIVCKYFTGDEEKTDLYLNKLCTFLDNYKSKTEPHILSLSHLIKDDLPYYFINKIEEANIIVGQQQLESLNQIICILKNKNKEDKIESIKKNNLQKCIHWCEKYKIPYNKFAEKVNIFLPFLKNDSIENIYVDTEPEPQLDPDTDPEIENQILNNNCDETEDIFI